MPFPAWGNVPNIIIIWLEIANLHSSDILRTEGNFRHFLPPPPPATPPRTQKFDTNSMTLRRNFLSSNISGPPAQKPPKTQFYPYYTPQIRFSASQPGPKAWFGLSLLTEPLKWSKKRLFSTFIWLENIDFSLKNLAVECQPRASRTPKNPKKGTPPTSERNKSPNFYKRPSRF
jgi:hypothetical protein